VIDQKEPPPIDPAQIEPAQIDSQQIAFVGLAIFTVATIVLLPFYGWLGDHGHRGWLWTCIAGVGVGLFGYALSWRHKRRGRTK
jgi:MFS family permease